MYRETKEGERRKGEKEKKKNKGRKRRKSWDYAVRPLRYARWGLGRDERNRLIDDQADQQSSHPNVQQRSGSRKASHIGEAATLA